MYPTLLKFGSFEITTFGLMMFLAFIIGGWVLTRRFRRSVHPARPDPARPSHADLRIAVGIRDVRHPDGRRPQAAREGPGLRPLPDPDGSRTLPGRNRPRQG